MSGFSEFLKRRRAILGLTQRDLARRSGVAQPLVADLETGAHHATDSTQNALREALTLRPSIALAARRDLLLQAIDQIGGRDPLVIGSVARGEDTPNSDLDLVITFPADASIIDLLTLEDTLSSILTVPVGIISAGSLTVRDSLQEPTLPM